MRQSAPGASLLDAMHGRRTWQPARLRNMHLDPIHRQA
jgi:hypothetical protein